MNKETDLFTGRKLNVGLEVGFTGTQRGLSHAQRVGLINLLKSLKPTKFHHGACVGADAEAHVIVRGLFSKDECKIKAHPSDIIDMTDKFAVMDADELAEAKRPLDRNQDIVDASQYVIAAPETDEEQLRSGTWSTIRRAKHAHKPLLRLMR